MRSYEDQWVYKDDRLFSMQATVFYSGGNGARHRWSTRHATRMNARCHSPSTDVAMNTFLETKITPNFGENPPWSRRSPQDWTRARFLWQGYINLLPRLCCSLTFLRCYARHALTRHAVQEMRNKLSYPRRINDCPWERIHCPLNDPANVQRLRENNQISTKIFLYFSYILEWSLSSW